LKQLDEKGTVKFIPVFGTHRTHMIQYTFLKNESATDNWASEMEAGNEGSFIFSGRPAPVLREARSFVPFHYVRPSIVSARRSVAANCR
jgi:hypothetical protein